MTRYMGFVRMAEGITEPPPQAMMDAMEDFIGKAAADGTHIDGGGLYGTEDAVNFVVRKGEATRVDGPYAEAKEVVGGWSLLEFASKEKAIEGARQLAQLHAEHWPEQELVITLRQVSDGPPQAD